MEMGEEWRPISNLLGVVPFGINVDILKIYKFSMELKIIIMKYWNPFQLPLVRRVVAVNSILALNLWFFFY